MTCESCPLRDTRQVPGYGPHGGIMVVGEAPGAHEVQQGRPFVGKAGQVLRATLKTAGADPDQVYYTNAVLCRPLGNKPPSPLIIAACNARLLEEIERVHPIKILPVGGIGLGALLDGTKGFPITRWRGMGFLYQDHIYTVPTYHPAAILRDDDLFRDLLTDITKLVRSTAPISPPEIDLRVPRTTEEALEDLDYILSASTLSCDIETTGFDPIENQILSIGFGALSTTPGQGSVVILPRALLNDNRIRERLLYIIDGDYSGPLIFHNIKFDLQFLEVLFGGPLRPTHPADTMLMRYAQDERPGGGSDTGSRAYRTHGLKDIARMRYDIPDYRFDFEGFLEASEEDRDWESLYRYQSLDCFLTARLYGDLLTELPEESPGLLKVVSDLLVPGALAFTDIELYGVLIDKEYLEKLRDQLEQELQDLTQQLQEVGRQFDMQDLNPGSPLQIRKLLFDCLKIPGNLTSTEREYLQELRRKVSPEQVRVIDLILDFRQKSKILSTYVNGILKRLGSDGRIRSDFLLHGSSTGRLSSQNPNLQNIPILMGNLIRNAFIASPGYKLIAADYSQLELRVAAWYSEDAALLQAYREGRDIHKVVAARMFDKPEEEITKYERYIAKYADFGIIYGRGAQSLATGWEMEHLQETLGMKPWTVKEAQKFLDEFLDGFPGLKQWIVRQHVFVRENGYVETPLGRRRRFPMTSRETASDIDRKAVNTPIQSLASDICLSSLIRLHRHLPEGAHILFSVHDSIFFEVREDLVDEVLLIIRDEMEHHLPIETSIPFPVDIKVGTRWGEMEEELSGP